MNRRHQVRGLVGLCLYVWIACSGCAPSRTAAARARATNALLIALGDENWRVRSSAAWALGMLGDQRAVEPLIATLAKHPTCSGAAYALGRLGDLRAVDVLLRAVRKGKLDPCIDAPDPFVMAVLALGRLNAIEVLFAEWRRKSPQLKGRDEGNDDTPLGEEALFYDREGDDYTPLSEHTDILFEALLLADAPDTLPRLRRAGTPDCLVQYLESSEPGLGGYSSAAALAARLREPRALDPLVRLLLQSLDPERDVPVHVWEGDAILPIARALAELDARRAVEILLAELKQDDAMAKVTALRALAVLGESADDLGPAAQDALLRALTDESPGVRAYAAAAIGRTAEGH